MADRYRNHEGKGKDMGEEKEILEFTKSELQKLRLVVIGVVINLFLVMITFGLKFISTAPSEDWYLQEESKLKSIGEKIEAIYNSTSQLQKNLKEITSQEKVDFNLGSHFNKKLSSSIKLITSKIQKLQTELDKAQNLLQKLKKKVHPH